MPAIFAVVMQLLSMGSKLKAAVYTLPYDAAITGDFSLPAKRVASVTVPTLVVSEKESDVRLRHAVGRRRRFSQCRAPHPERSAPQRLSEIPRFRIGGVLPWLKRHLTQASPLRRSLERRAHRIGKVTSVMRCAVLAVGTLGTGGSVPADGQNGGSLGPLSTRPRPSGRSRTGGFSKGNYENWWARASRSARRPRA
jgi:hypothetical protein